MVVYRYRAFDSEGLLQTGELEASDQSAAVDQLQALGLLPVAAVAFDGPASRTGATPGNPRGRRVPQKQIALFTRKLATVIQAGLELDKGLEIAGSLGRTENLQRMVERVLVDLRGGKSLSDALAVHEPHFPRYYVPMVRAGEASGKLAPVLAHIATLMEESERLRQSVRSALAYPAILMVTAVGSIILLMTVVLPRFEPLFRDAGRELPLITRIFMAASDAMIAYGPALLLALLLAALLLQRKRREPGFRLGTDRLLLRAPVLGDVITRLEVALVTRTLGMLVQNGVPLLSGLAIVEASLTNTALAKGLGDVRTAVKNGSSFAVALQHAGIFPSLAVQLAAVGEASGRLAEMLIETSALYDDEMRTLIQRLLTLLTPTITLALSLLIVGIIGSVLVAVLSVNDLVM
ncbi:type II secretion system F family protein [Rhodospirillaceae bacterium SYSU D60014]|uniref:type II secretion system F family protein n=1 Tax=Virgifigura deserti TaxID=2268457 RepID=UPI000E6701F8